MVRSVVPSLLLMAGMHPFTSAAEAHRPPDFAKEKVLYVVPYSHLDTQWRWTYITTIDSFIKNTINENLQRFRDHPENVFTFTGSSRFDMMREYYPEGFAQVRELIRSGRWKIGGSSVDEADAIVPSPESILRQILYGNQYFRREFGVESIDYMVPDCFGFPANLPSIVAHAGLRGFSTQKLVWGLPFKIPFTVGYWAGPDGKGVISAFYGTDYTGRVEERLDLSDEYLQRITTVGAKSGLFVDYRYFGVGDRGGAPRDDDIRRALASRNQSDSKFKVMLTGSDQMFRDLPPDAEQRLPRYQGDLLLREHSSGSITSQAYMKRWNRKNEQLIDAAERAAVAASHLGVMTYPSEQIARAWDRILVSQMHDILPGTSLPKAYDLSWNDEVLALNLSAGVVEEATQAVVSQLDTRTDGIPLVVYNPLAIPRDEVVEATVRFDGRAPSDIEVRDHQGNVRPSQVLRVDGNAVTLLVHAQMESLSWTVLDVRPGAPQSSSTLRITERDLENEFYRVTLNDAGDVASIIDKRHGGREMLSAPHQWHFQYHKPKSFPAWNMDWQDQRQPPAAILQGPASIRIVEQGPARVALEVRRESHDSVFVQTIRLAAGEAGRRVEFQNFIDWQGRECALKAAFPLTVSNAKATYNLGMGTIERPSNSPDQYEVPHREWLDLTHEDQSYGISILEDSKFGSDKPNDNTLRLTLLYTPGVRDEYRDQASQDWGRHEVLYALYGHDRDWREGTEWQARRLNQPAIAFQAERRPGSKGRSYSFATVTGTTVDLRTVKQSEDGTSVIVRLQELAGRPAPGAAITFAASIDDAWEVDGQERRLGKASFTGKTLQADLGSYGLKSFAVRLRSPGPSSLIASQPVDLPFNADVVSTDANRRDGLMDEQGRSYPAEEWPRELEWNGRRFQLGSTAPGDKNAVVCQGQSLELPVAGQDRIALLVAATERAVGQFQVGDQQVDVPVGAWTGFIGQYDNRVWDRVFPDIDYRGEGRVVGLTPAFIHREPVAWYARHRHAMQANEAYRFTYLYTVELPLPTGARSLRLPKDSRIRLFAASLVKHPGGELREVHPLYDQPDRWGPLALRVKDPTEERVRGLQPLGMSIVDRQPVFGGLSMGAPRQDDAASRARGASVSFLSQGGRFLPHPQSGAVGQELPRLNDGEIAQNDDDTKRCSWFDQEGRLLLDLQRPTEVMRVNTYSWHKSNRAPQRFTLWGSSSPTMPDAFFSTGGTSGWTYLGRVDSHGLGHGQCHGSSVMAKDGGLLGKYRWLLWIADEVGEGTFFTELDVETPRQP